VLAGVIVGLAGAIALGRAVSAMLYGLTPNDPATITFAISLMVVVAALAGYLPARRAARVDPMVALRHD
jgi:ABC-type antimicrobial peptide transport system permease subunit